MAFIALVDGADQIVRMVREHLIDQTAGVRTGYKWLPIVDLPDNDTSTGPDVVKSAPVFAVEPTRVTAQITIRDMTAQELSDDKDAKVSRADKVLYEVLFEIVNRVLTLEGGSAVSRVQFAAYVKGLI